MNADFKDKELIGQLSADIGENLRPNLMAFERTGKAGPTRCGY
jgi:hypothetical protein